MGYFHLKFPNLILLKIQVFPTPESPNKHTLKICIEFAFLICFN